MSEMEKLRLYLERVEKIAKSKIKDEKKSAMVALKESLHYLEGEMQGY